MAGRRADEDVLDPCPKSLEAFLVFEAGGAGHKVADDPWEDGIKPKKAFVQVKWILAAWHRIASTTIFDIGRTSAHGIQDVAAALLYHKRRVILCRSKAKERISL